MVKRLQIRRMLILAALLGGAFAVLAYRLVDLQALRHEEFLAIEKRNTQRESRREPRRGDILDIKGNLLATSVPVKSIYADLNFMGDRYPEMARLLAPLLKINEVHLAELIRPRLLRTNDHGGPVYASRVLLKRKFRPEDWNVVRSALTNETFGMDPGKLSRTNRIFLQNLREKAVVAVNTAERYYPNRNLAAHVVGYVGQLDPESELSGMDGIEATLNGELTGVRGWRVTERNRNGEEVVPLREEDVEPRDGLNAVLAIDSMIQQIVESALAQAMKDHSPLSASAIVARPRTGEILAMATLPNFDPNDLGASSADARRNRVIADQMEPGSTFKTVVVSGALNEHVVTLDDVFFCENGIFHYAGYPLHDAEHHFANLTVKEIVMKSSNIGAAKIGIQLGPERLYHYAREFGFGERTGIALPGEIKGTVWPVNKWSKLSIARIPMGQGIAVTRLQMTMAICALANKGWLMRPMIVDRLEDGEKNVVAQYSPQRVRRVVSPATDKLMVEALKTVVSPEGTAPKAALEHYTVGGKTGTAQKVADGHYLEDQFVSTFIGFFPADDPELCISVVLDDPKNGHFGGAVAGPVFKDIAERAANYLNIRPDIQDARPAAAPTMAAIENNAVKTAAARPPFSP